MNPLNTASTPVAIPQPPTIPLLRNAHQLGATTPVQNMMKIAQQYGEIVRLELPLASVIIASTGELARELCDETRFDKYLHGPLRQVRDFAGDALFTAETSEPAWGAAHRLLMPAFGMQAMRGYHDMMLDVAQQLVDRWARLGPGAQVDIPDQMTRLTLDTIALCGFGYRFNSFYREDMHPFVESMVRALSESLKRSHRLPLLDSVMVRSRHMYEADIARMNAIVDSVIQERRASGAAGQRDLLSLMLDGADPKTGEQLTDENIRQQVITFLIAGHETTSGLLSFAIYNLLQDPAVMAAARAEADAVLGDGAPTFEQVRQLKFIGQILKESLRLWPTAPAFAVYPAEDTLLAGKYKIRAGEGVTVLIPMLHRDPLLWPDPERFDPSRFTPEAEAARPSYAFKPFGNGQRACIGNQFALQEATLVLGMILRRFELIDHTDYKLVVKETLTLKPDNFHLRIRERAERPQATQRASAPTPQATPAASRVASHGTPLLVLYGSNMGSAEAIARQLADEADARGFVARVAPMDDHVEDLPRAGAVLIVTASYNGHAPDNAARFVAWLDGARPGALEGVRYAVFGCGNRDWAATYQAIPTRVDERLAACGAERLCARGEADGRADFFGDLEAWRAPMWAQLCAALAVPLVPEPAPAARYTVQRLAHDAEQARCARHGVAPMTIVESRSLVAPEARPKRHLAVQLPAGVTYVAGDYLSVLPAQDEALVARMVARLGLSADEVIVVQDRLSDAALPVAQPVALGELLRWDVELQDVVTQAQIGRLVEVTPCPPERRKLEALAADRDAYRAQILTPRVSLLELLEGAPSCTPELALVLELLPARRLRHYSIASSPVVHPDRCELTVSVVDAPHRSGQGDYKGACSTYLAGLEVGARILARVRPPQSPFRLPEDPSAPIILIGAGTGIAPLRAFLQEREALAGGGQPAGEALLCFGCDRRDLDFLYAEELEAWQAAGVAQVEPAFSAAEPGEFVQHRLAACGDRVWGLIERGATIYVCGDGSRMAPAVRAALEQICRDHTGDDEAAARAWLAELESSRRYLADVWSAT
jgi:cytochrome P450 / NADPH-cytochrome P450 reductase